MRIRESWSTIIEQRMIILYMLVSGIALAVVFHYTCPTPGELEKINKMYYEKKDKADEYVETNSLPPMNTYGTRDFAFSKQQHYDTRDMGLIQPPPTF